MKITINLVNQYLPDSHDTLIHSSHAGNHVTAYDAEKMGLVSKVFPPDQVLSESIKAAEKIASSSQIIAKFAKDAVNTAFETTLNEGIKFEKQLSDGTFATKDRKEGMQAFYEKRAPNFINE